MDFVVDKLQITANIIFKRFGAKDKSEILLALAL